MPNEGKDEAMKIHSIYDNGGTTADRYTVYYGGRGSLYIDHRGDRVRECVGMSEHPFHPQGFGQHSSGQPGKHNGKRITFDQLPPDCQKLVRQDLEG
jgi:hypothetical protein